VASAHILPIKILTNLITDIYPTILFDLFIDLWKVKTIGSGDLKITMNTDAISDDYIIKFNMDRIGNSPVYLASLKLSRSEIQHFQVKKEEINHTKRLVHNPVSRIEKVDWIGIVGSCGLFQWYLLVWKNYSLKQMMDEILKSSGIQIYGTHGKIKSFMALKNIDGGSPLCIAEGEGIRMVSDPPFNSEIPIGIAIEDIKSGELAEILIGTELEKSLVRKVRDKNEKSIDVDKLLTNTVVINQAYINQTYTKREKIFVIESVESIRKRLERRK